MHWYQLLHPHIVGSMIRDATRTVQKSRKVSGVWGQSPQRGPGAAPHWGSKGQSPLEARAFSKSELPRKPPIDTHGRYTYNTCTKKKKKSQFRQKSEKWHTSMIFFLGGGGATLYRKLGSLKSCYEGFVIIDLFITRFHYTTEKLSLKSQIDSNLAVIPWSMSLISLLGETSSKTFSIRIKLQKIKAD